ncbi:uncharacterized protein ALTATR162_LOCUS7002 [Alternaria atra]|uniref:AB hydrolase-1 domain-containing protein n=1 Tax=Alternaria atra TaxID=119953 RepID=A0A8J2N783_9PLEO|nr:uncharacterized protein ALTATR162_LOCUS7002 [Alternaria atra]CAG5169121.1 unnamed protein product [Alternaria atra]
MWADVAGPLRSSKYPIIVPDMLGYDGTDKPTDTSAYRWDGMAKDLIEIIEAEQHEKVVSIGHDWGSVAASRLCQHYPDRVVGLINLNVPYTPLFCQPFDLKMMNDTTKEHFGYRIFSYWEVFTADDGAEIIDKNLERLYSAMHGQGETMKDLFCTPGALREVRHFTSIRITQIAKGLHQDQTNYTVMYDLPQLPLTSN